MANVIHIDDAADPRVADYLNVRDRDLIRRRGVFMAEGELVVRTLVKRSRLHTRSALVTQPRFDAMRDLWPLLADETPVYVAPAGVMDRIVGFHIHRGALAAGERESSQDASLLVRSGARRGAIGLVLEDLANHDNVGGVFRNAAAFGAGFVLITPRCCDPLYRKAIRVSMGATLTVPFAEAASTAAALEMARGAGFRTIALTPAADAPALDELTEEMRRGGRVALALGAEGSGLTEEAMRQVDVCARIPIVADVDSLNVASASAVGLHVARRALGSPGESIDAIADGVPELPLPGRALDDDADR